MSQESICDQAPKCWWWGVFGEARSHARTLGLWWVHGRTRLQKELISGGHKTASVHASALPLLRRGPQEEFARRRRALRPPRAIASAAAAAAAAAAHIKASTTFSRPRCRLLDKCVSSHEGCVLGRGGEDETCADFPMKKDVVNWGDIER